MKLFNYQKDILNQTKDQTRVAYYLDMGLGKTFIGSEKVIRYGDGGTILIVCQKSKITDWIEHFEQQYAFRPRNLTKRDEFQLFLSNEQQVGVINYELAWRRKQLLDLKDFTLLLDESSLIQNAGTKQSKFIMALKPSRVVLLSGTPTSGKYENLWTQLYLLGWKVKESTFLSQFVNFKQIYVSGGVTRWVVDKDNPYKNQERLNRKLREFGAVFLKTDEVLDLPEQNDIVVKIPLSQKYRQFQKHKIVELDSDTILVGDTKLTYMLRLRQLCGAYSLAKIEALKDLLKSTRNRVIIYYNFTSELELIKAIIGDRPISEVNGITKNLEAYEKESDSITVIQYQAGAMGLNLQKANQIIYFTPTLRSELFEQSKKRIHRIGQTQPCFYYYLTVENSIEEQIYHALEQRKDFTDALFIEVD